MKARGIRYLNLNANLDNIGQQLACKSESAQVDQPRSSLQYILPYCVSKRKDSRDKLQDLALLLLLHDELCAVLNCDVILLKTLQSAVAFTT